MSFKRHKVLAALLRQGMEVLREGGAHTIVGKPDGVRTSLPRHVELDRLTVKAIAKQLQIDWESFQKEIR
jgi:predicted RNA binding protein YcfA (HicA-like mRNA interferase family)